jgi:hypothetical protein
MHAQILLNYLRFCSALKHVADVAKTWGKLSPRLQRKKEKSSQGETAFAF